MYHADPHIFGRAAATRGFARHPRHPASGPDHPPEWDDDPDDDSNRTHARITEMARLRRLGESLIAADHAEAIEEQAS